MRPSTIWKATVPSYVCSYTIDNIDARDRYETCLLVLCRRFSARTCRPRHTCRYPCGPCPTEPWLCVPRQCLGWPMLPHPLPEQLPLHQLSRQDPRLPRRLSDGGPGPQSPRDPHHRPPLRVSSQDPSPLADPLLAPSYCFGGCLRRGFPMGFPHLLDDDVTCF